MNAKYETPARFSATGVSTVSILLVMLAMAASTLLPPKAPSRGKSGFIAQHVPKTIGEGQTRQIY